jgi:methyl-accepting chemotaxis protein
MKLGLAGKIMSIIPLALAGIAVAVGSLVWYARTTGYYDRLEAARIAFDDRATELQIDFLELRRKEKDFLLRKDTKYAAEHAEIVTEIQKELPQLGAELPDDLKSAVEITGKIAVEFSAYAKVFADLKAANDAIGYTPEEGLQGEFRAAAHTLEAAVTASKRDALLVDLLMMRRHEKDFLLRLDQKYVDKLNKQAESFAARPASDFGSQAVKDEALKTLSAYGALFNKMATTIMAENEMRSEISKVFKPIEPEFEALRAQIAQALTQAREAKAANGEFALQLSILLAAVVSVIVGLAIWLMGRSVAKPIRNAVETMRALESGDVDRAVDGMQRTDEVGDMARALEAFRQNAIAKIQTERTLQENNLSQEAERGRVREQEAARIAALDQATHALASGLKRLAGGDLSVQLNEAFAPDFEPLRVDFNRSIAQLEKTVTAVEQSIAIMENGTREIAAGANDLSRRTEQQAASLEETAAALDEITANVGGASKLTEDGRGVTRSATESATRSTKVVANAEEAMQRIEDSSQKISNIIGVIDEIAFQTNLLALNAGVEAARAGEAGKGFAVVAQEVRELAQRSATAAKEIKTLIQTSSDEVEGGVRLVRETGQSLREIMQFIHRIGEQMDSVANSAREQATGLSQINVAVNQLDQTTQQNAAMVEQSTAAAAALASEATNLRGLVGQFTLARTPSERTSASQQMAWPLAS